MIATILLLAGLLAAQAPGTVAFLSSLQPLPLAERSAAIATFLRDRRLPIVEDDSVVTFMWVGRAESVYVNGALHDGWRRPARMVQVPCSGDSSLFYLRTTAPADAMLEYQLVIDGRYSLDPGNVRTTPSGDYRNSQAVMGRFRASPWTTVNAKGPQGALDTLMFAPADSGLAPRKIFVYRPHGLVPRDGYALLLVNDGGTALQFLSLTAIADTMIAAGEVPAFIAVFVPAVERVPEYRGLKEVRYLNALADELVPLIENRYGTAHDPYRRAVLGGSDGGHCALLAPLLRGDVFGLAAGQSSTIDRDLLTALESRTRYALLPARVRIFQQVGAFDIVSDEYHFLSQNRQFAALLGRTGIHHRFVVTNDGHDWPSWRERVPEILRFLFKPH